MFVCHPEVLEQLKQKLQEKIDRDIIYGIHSPFGLAGVKITTNSNLDAKRQVGWKRTNVMADDKYCSMVDDLTNPPSWAIYFGLVEPVYEALIYEIDDRRMTFFSPEGPMYASVPERKEAPISFNTAAWGVELSLQQLNKMRKCILYGV